jgi:Xaa-Pro dipeptidase
MRAASRLNDMAMGRLIALLPGQYPEKKLARAVAEIYDELGADGCAFDPIIAYGPNAAEGHHAPSDRRLEEGDAVVLDIGCKQDGYCSDMTRTLFYRRASAEARAVYRTVLEAQEKAIAAVRPGDRFCDVDRAARAHITAAGYGPCFTHRTGHSIGLEVHDHGDVSAANREPL